MANMIIIESAVPFGHILYTQLYLRNLRLAALGRRDQLEDHYLAWETVRKQINPFFLEGTGFEGYLIGRCRNAEAALEAIVNISQNMLDAIARLYRFRYNFHSRLMKTLLREMSDPTAIHVWSGCLGAELGKLRAQIIGNREAEAFQARTYRIVSGLPPMVYHQQEGDITQTYAIGSPNGAHNSRISVDWRRLKPNQQDAWLVAENIGEFGHPLVRKLLI